MTIKTNRPIYFGRPDLNAIRTNTPDPEFGFCNPIIPDGETEPFCIPTGTEVVKLDGSQFSSKEEFLDERAGNCYFTYKDTPDTEDLNGVFFDDEEAYDFID